VPNSLLPRPPSWRGCRSPSSLFPIFFCLLWFGKDSILRRPLVLPRADPLFLPSHRDCTLPLCPPFSALTAPHFPEDREFWTSGWSVPFRSFSCRSCPYSDPTLVRGPSCHDPSNYLSPFFYSRKVTQTDLQRTFSSGP